MFQKKNNNEGSGLAKAPHAPSLPKALQPSSPAPAPVNSAPKAPAPVANSAPAAPALTAAPAAEQSSSAPVAATLTPQPVQTLTPKSTNTGGHRNSLSADVEITGSIRFQDELTIDGKVEGQITSTGNLSVLQNALIRAEINVGAIIVHGKVYGNISASQSVELKSGSEVIGDIKTANLTMEPGSIFVGRSDVGTPAAETSTPAATATVATAASTHSNIAASTATPPAAAPKKPAPAATPTPPAAAPASAPAPPAAPPAAAAAPPTAPTPPPSPLAGA